MINYQGLRLTGSFASQEQAVKVLNYYFRELGPGNRGFTGGQWDGFDPSGTRAASAGVFTVDDLVACALLSAPIPGRAALELLTRRRNDFIEGLKVIGDDRDLIDLKDPPAELRAMSDLYKSLCALPGVGMTRATKLMARKRPRLVPIVDSVINKSIFQEGPKHWEPLYEALVANDQELWTWLTHVKEISKVQECVPTIRIFDVLAWMDSTGNTTHALANSH